MSDFNRLWLVVVGNNDWTERWPGAKSLNSFSVSLLPLYASLEKLDRRYLESSLDLGATQLQTFWRVTLPLSLPGIFTGVILVFIPALGTFVISDLLGGPDSQLIGNVIERQFKSTNNWPLGSAMPFILLYITFVALMLRAYFGRKNGGS